MKEIQILSKSKFLIVCFLCLIFNLQTEASTLRSNFVDNINNGIKLAEQLLGLSNNVADLVSQTFSQKRGEKRHNARQDSATIGSEGGATALDQSMISGMLKLLGFDGAKIGAAAVNGIIFIAQLVRYGMNQMMSYTMGRMWDWYRIVDYVVDRYRTSNNTFYNEVEIPVPTPEQIGSMLTDSGSNNVDNVDVKQKVNKKTNKKKGEKVDEDAPNETPIFQQDPFDWLLKNEKVLEMLNEVRDQNLPDKLIEMVKAMEEIEGETDCIKLLLCKLKPFIWAMQKAVIKKIDDQPDAPDEDDKAKKTAHHSRKAILFKYLPDINEFKNNGMECEIKFNRCKIF